MELGAEAVSVSIVIGGPGPTEALERFGRITEDARRVGMPVFAEIIGEDWLEVARLGADYGADVIQACFVPNTSSYRSFTRITGRPFLARLDEFELAPLELLALVNEAIEGAAQGLVLGQGVLAQPGGAALVRAVHGLVHQGISVEEALDTATGQLPGLRSQESEGALSRISHQIPVRRGCGAGFSLPRPDSSGRQCFSRTGTTRLGTSAETAA